MEDEVNLDVLLNASKKVFLPIYDKVNKNYRMAQVQHSKDLVEGIRYIRTFRNMSCECERHFPMVDLSRAFFDKREIGLVVAEGFTIGCLPQKMV